MTAGHRRVVVGFGVLVLTGVLVACESPVQPWQNELVSVNAAGTNGGSGESSAPVFSPDGTKVAFESLGGCQRCCVSP